MYQEVHIPDMWLIPFDLAIIHFFFLFYFLFFLHCNKISFEILLLTGGAFPWLRHFWKLLTFESERKWMLKRTCKESPSKETIVTFEFTTTTNLTVES